jgi:hypothetical protein
MQNKPGRGADARSHFTKCDFWFCEKAPSSTEVRPEGVSEKAHVCILRAPTLPKTPNPPTTPTTPTTYYLLLSFISGTRDRPARPAMLAFAFLFFWEWCVCLEVSVALAGFFLGVGCVCWRSRWSWWVCVACLLLPGAYQTVTTAITYHAASPEGGTAWYVMAVGFMSLARVEEAVTPETPPPRPRLWPQPAPPVFWPLVLAGAVAWQVGA